MELYKIIIELIKKVNNLDELKNIKEATNCQFKISREAFIKEFEEKINRIVIRQDEKQTRECCDYNFIITPKGDFMRINPSIIDLQLSILLKSEFGIDMSEIIGDMYNINFILYNYGYISVITNNDGSTVILMPEKILPVQMKIIKLEYALGRIPENIYKELINYNK